MRKLHRKLALLFSGFLALSAITGLIWAFAHRLYLKEDNLKTPAGITHRSLAEATVPMNLALEQARIRVAGPIHSIALKTLAHRLVYDVRYGAGKEELSWLMDAETGQTLSPLSDSFATSIVESLQRTPAPIKGIQHTPSYRARNGRTIPQVHQITLDASDHPVIVICSDSGELVEKVNDSRRIHTWIMRLHTLSFFGFRKTLTLIPGLGMLALLITGFKLYWKKTC